MYKDLSFRASPLLNCSFAADIMTIVIHENACSCRHYLFPNISADQYTTRVSGSLNRPHSTPTTPFHYESPSNETPSKAAIRRIKSASNFIPTNLTNHEEGYYETRRRTDEPKEVQNTDSDVIDEGGSSELPVWSKCISTDSGFA